MAIFPFILVKHAKMKTDRVLIRHEMIHLKQEMELLILPFYLLYVLNYVVNLYRYKNHHIAYMNIVFEREAYKNEANSSYLTSRRVWAWLKYMKHAAIK
jgi:hypothetical protein